MREGKREEEWTKSKQDRERDCSKVTTIFKL